MNLFRADKIMNRLDKMMDQARNGQPMESSFDETKMSALETKLSHYLAMNQTKKEQLAEEKLRVHQLVSDISHQTKTPIANIVLYAQLLEESDLAEEEKEWANMLTAQAQKLNFLIASLVKTSRLENGIISLTPEENEIQPMLSQVLQQAEADAYQKGIAILCEKTNVHAVFDPKWTLEAIENIVDNAIKYSPTQSTITMNVTAYQFFCRIDITDQGMGISEEETAKIFTRFYRSAAASEKEGVGIGLSLAREILASEGGYIKVKSELLKGSTFSVFLPMRREGASR